MITTTTNNFAVSPKIYSWGFLSLSDSFTLLHAFAQGFSKPPMPPSLTANYNPFMQNKPNLLHTQMNVTTALTMAYQNIKPSRRLKNKPNFESTTPKSLRPLLICKTNPISKKVKSV